MRTGQATAASAGGGTRTGYPPPAQHPRCFHPPSFAYVHLRRRQPSLPQRSSTPPPQSAASQPRPAKVFWMFSAPQQWPFLRVSSLLVANQPKCLCMNRLHAKRSFSNRVQSCLIMLFFSNHNARHTITPLLRHSTGFFVFRGPNPPPFF